MAKIISGRSDLHFLPPFIPPKLPVPRSGIAVVTGATSGIGRATAQLLAQEGFTVIGSSRSPSALTDAIPGVNYLRLDLEDPASIREFVAEVLVFGRPCVVINNAGESQSGPLEELPREALERLFQVNVIGHIDLTQRLLPTMRAARHGRIIMVGSMLGSFPLAYRSSYVASKAAIKGFAFSARRELTPFGVGMSVVEPGAINTGLSSRRTNYITADSVYAREFHQMLTRLNHNEATGIHAQRVAAEILSAIRSPRPRALYAIGSQAHLAFPAARILPRETMLWLINRRHGL